MSERYEIHGKIGQGGRGAVYRAYDTQLDRDVAIKRLFNPEGDAFSGATDELKREASILATLNHPNIVTIYDYESDDEGAFVVMELLEGKTVSQAARDAPLTESDFKALAEQTMEAMVAAQDLNLTHRDLKPSNLFITWLASGRFQAKILDFGLAKFSHQPSLQTVNQNDEVLGSIHCMAPEQFDHKPLDGRTDLYQLACVYYFSLTGRYPFTGDSPADIMKAHFEHDVTPLHELRPDVDKTVCDWVMWLMNPRPDDRPPNAKEALRTFRALGKEAGVIPRIPSRPASVDIPATVPADIALPMGAQRTLASAPGALPTGNHPTSPTNPTSSATTWAKRQQHFTEKKKNPALVLSMMGVLVAAAAAGALILTSDDDKKRKDRRARSEDRRPDQPENVEPIVDPEENRNPNSLIKPPPRRGTEPAVFIHVPFDNIPLGPVNTAAQYKSKGIIFPFKFEGSKFSVVKEGLKFKGLVTTGGCLEVHASDIHQVLIMKPDRSKNSLLTKAGLTIRDRLVGGENINGTIYYSFLLRKVEGAPGDLCYFCIRRNEKQKLLALGSVNRTEHFVAREQSGKFKTLNRKTKIDKKTHFYVVRVDFNSEGDDRMRVWLDPNPGVHESNQPDNIITHLTNKDFSFARMRFKLDVRPPKDAINTKWQFDELRFGSSWNMVTPTK